MTSARSSKNMLIIASVLLLIGAGRMVVLNQLTMNPDEVWSAWQTLGTPQQIINWTPYDWPPGYYLTLGGWRALTGQIPLTERYLSVLAFLIGAAALYRVVKRLRGFEAGVLAALAYGALAYGILLSTEVRGYGLLMGLMPVTLWLTVRYFDVPTVRLRRGVLVGISLAALFYISVTSVGAFLMLGIYTLIVYGRRVRYWWLPGVVGGILALPEIVSKLGLGISRTAATSQEVMPPLPDALVSYYRSYGGSAFAVWIGLFVAATALVFYRRKLSRRTLALLLWVFAAPTMMYVLHPVLGFFSVRYDWWMMIGLAVWAAWGLFRLPRWGIAGVSVLLVGIMFTPVPFHDYSIFDTLSPLETNFIWLKDHMTSGDVFVADPSMQCGTQEIWDYYLRTYFPTGLQFVKQFEGYRRIWYVTTDGRQNPELQAEVMKGRVPGRFVGPPGCLFRLYEAPPDSTGILFENGMRFHGVDVMDGDRPWSAPLVRHEGESVRIRLWWTVDHPVDLDYSVGTYMLWSRGQVITQVDSAPQLIYPEDAPVETSRWEPGQYYIEERELTLPFPTPKTTYSLRMAVYFWGDNVRVSAPGQDANHLLLLTPVRVMSY